MIDLINLTKILGSSEKVQSVIGEINKGLQNGEPFEVVLQRVTNELINNLTEDSSSESANLKIEQNIKPDNAKVVQSGKVLDRTQNSREMNVDSPNIPELETDKATDQTNVLTSKNEKSNLVREMLLTPLRDKKISDTDNKSEPEKQIIEIRKLQAGDSENSSDSLEAQKMNDNTGSLNSSEIVDKDLPNTEELKSQLKEFLTEKFKETLHEEQTITVANAQTKTVTDVPTIQQGTKRSTQSENINESEELLSGTTQKNIVGNVEKTAKSLEVMNASIEQRANDVSMKSSVRENVKESITPKTVISQDTGQNRSKLVDNSISATGKIIQNEPRNESKVERVFVGNNDKTSGEVQKGTEKNRSDLASSSLSKNVGQDNSLSGVQYIHTSPIRSQPNQNGKNNGVNTVHDYVNGKTDIQDRTQKIFEANSRLEVHRNSGALTVGNPVLTLVEEITANLKFTEDVTLLFSSSHLKTHDGTQKISVQDEKSIKSMIKSNNKAFGETESISYSSLMSSEIGNLAKAISTKLMEFQKEDKKGTDHSIISQPNNQKSIILSALSVNPKSSQADSVGFPLLSSEKTGSVGNEAEVNTVVALVNGELIVKKNLPKDVDSPVQKSTTKDDTNTDVKKLSEVVTTIALMRRNDSDKMIGDSTVRELRGSNIENQGNLQNSNNENVSGKNDSSTIRNNMQEPSKNKIEIKSFEVEYKLKEEERQNKNIEKPNVSNKFVERLAELTYKNGETRIEQTYQSTNRFELAERLQNAQNLEEIYQRIREFGLSTRLEETVRMKLYPEHLGNLDVELKKEGRILSLIFVAENEKSKELLEKNVSYLRDRLVSLDFEVRNVEIKMKEEDGSYEQGRYQRNQGENNQEDNRRKNYKQEVSADDDERERNV
ncbi:MAG: flagellar hook-length control protein FliK [Fervidobacterium sp.]|uniref:flagellar hook-length control protein FliK n=1 Tax=Fervidobacterium sp. TaxID=1871331 RepID=UPI00404A3C6F